MKHRFSLTTLSTITGTLTALVGLLVLTGWQFDIDLLKNPLAGTVSMKANTAAAFLLAGLALIFLQRSGITKNLLARICALISGIKSLLQASKWVEDTNQVENQLDLVLSHVLEVQSNGRGFILTGNDEYLIPREKASRELSTLMNSLRFQIADDPRQQELFASLEKLVEERVAFSDRLVSTRKTEGEAEARLLFATNRGKMITDSIRVLLAQMMSEEDRLLQMRQKTEEDHMSQTQIIIYFSVVVQILLLAFIFVVVKRDVLYIGASKNIRKRLSNYSGSKTKNVRLKLYVNGFDLFVRYFLTKNYVQVEKELLKHFKKTYGELPKANRSGG